MPKILFVDDEPSIVKVISFRLQQAGYEVIVAGDGQEGYEKAKKESPDIIILDLMLPKMDGYKVCGLLKADARHKKIPVILFTARGGEHDKDIGRDVGADAYVEKMSDPEVLLEKVKELLKR